MQSISKSYNETPRKITIYTSVNSYNHTPSIHFILTVFLFISQICLHSIFIIRPVMKINHTLLYIMFAVHYLLFLIIAFDFIYLTCTDPADPALKNQQVLEKYKSNEIKYCPTCTKTVNKKSYHCNKCNRCTDDIDHHCKYLNNCIGKRNYQYFLRLLFIMIGYNINCIGQGVWVFIKAVEDAAIDFQAFSKWAVLVFIILSFAVLIAIAVLLSFHVYINCCESMTTLEYILQNRKQSVYQQKQKNNQTGMRSNEVIRNEHW